MKAKQYTEEQIVAVLKEGEAGAKVSDLCRKYGMSDATYYNWKAMCAGMTVSDLKRLKALEEENHRLKQISWGTGARHQGAEGHLKRLLKPKAKRLAVSYARNAYGLSLRKACLLIGISVSVCLYRPRVAGFGCPVTRCSASAEEKSCGRQSYYADTNKNQ